MEYLVQVLEHPNPAPIFAVGVLVAAVSVGALKVMPMLPWLGIDDDDENDESTDAASTNNPEKKNGDQVKVTGGGLDDDGSDASETAAGEKESTLQSANAEVGSHNASIEDSSQTSEQDSSKLAKKSKAKKPEDQTDNEILQMSADDEEKYIDAMRRLMPYTDEATIRAEYARAKAISADQARKHGLEGAVSQAQSSMQGNSAMVRGALDTLVILAVAGAALFFLMRDKVVTLDGLLDFAKPYFPRELATVLGNIDPHGGGDEQEGVGVGGVESLAEVTAVPGIGTGEEL